MMIDLCNAAAFKEILAVFGGTVIALLILCVFAIAVRGILLAFTLETRVEEIEKKLRGKNEKK